MIDYTKLERKDNIYAQYLRTHDLLSDRIEVKNTARGTTKVIAQYKGMNFTIHDNGFVVIDGSLHKYYNNGLHNHNDFAIYNIKEVINDLSAKFGKQILSFRISNLEYGLNIRTPFKAIEFTRSTLAYVKTGVREQGREKMPITKDDRKGFDKGIKFMHSQEHLKLYDKGFQHDLEYDLFRGEFKTIKKQIIEDVAINTLPDLIDCHKLSMLHNKLIESLSYLIIKEKIDVTQLTNREKLIWQECVNRDNWVHIWNKEKRRQRKTQFIDIQNRYAQSDMLLIIIDLFNAKFKQLAKEKNTHCFTALQKVQLPTALPLVS